jgi:hypothetical protein
MSGTYTFDSDAEPLFVTDKGTNAYYPAIEHTMSLDGTPFVNLVRDPSLEPNKYPNVYSTIHVVNDYYYYPEDFYGSSAYVRAGGNVW